MKLFSIFEDENGEQLEVADKQARETLKNNGYSNVYNLELQEGKWLADGTLDTSEANTYCTVGYIGEKYGDVLSIRTNANITNYLYKVTSDNYTVVSPDYNGQAYIVSVDDSRSIRLNFKTNLSIDKIKIDIRLNEQQEKTRRVDAELEYIGWSVPGNCWVKNFFDVSSNKLIQKVGRVYLPDLAWEKTEDLGYGNSVYMAELNDAYMYNYLIIEPCYSNIFSNDEYNANVYSGMASNSITTYVVDGKNYVIISTTKNTIEEFTSYLKSNKAYFYYRLTNYKTHYDGEEISTNINQTLGELEYGEISANNNICGMENRYYYYPLKAGDIITVSKADSSQQMSVANSLRQYDSSGNQVDYWGLGNSTLPRTITIEKASTYLKFDNNDIDLMVNVGNTALPYEGYSVSVKYLDEKTTNINSNLLCLNVLGYEVPEEVLPWYIKQNGRQVTVYGGRVDYGNIPISITTTNGVSVFVCTPEDRKGGSSKLYCSKYTTKENGRWDLVNNDKAIASWDTSSSKIICTRDTAYTTTDAFQNANKGIYFYYELAEPITYTIDGNEAISKVNDSLSDYGMDNKFDGQLRQGYINASGVFTSDNECVTIVNKISCKNAVKIKTSETVSYIVVSFFTADNTFITRKSSSINVKELYTNVPSGTDYIYFHIQKNGGLKTDTKIKITCYADSSFDEIKADLYQKTYKTNGLTYNANASYHSGGYVEIGNLVVVNLRLTINDQISGGSTADAAIVKGLPKGVNFGEGSNLGAVTNNAGLDIGFMPNYLSGASFFCNSGTISSGSLRMSCVYIKE